jgi:hypothetical protein
LIAAGCAELVVTPPPFVKAMDVVGLAGKVTALTSWRAAKRVIVLFE